MSRFTVLAVALSFSLAPSCAKDSPGTNSLESPTDRATAPNPDDSASPEEVEERFSHRSYPTETIANKGPLGKARGGNLVAAAGQAKFDITESWSSGPAVVIFYRGHW